MVFLQNFTKFLARYSFSAVVALAFRLRTIWVLYYSFRLFLISAISLFRGAIWFFGALRSSSLFFL